MCPSINFGDVSPSWSNGLGMEVMLAPSQVEWGPEDFSLLSSCADTN